MSGFRMYQPALPLTARTGIGYSPIWAGPGFLIIHGAGRRFTMAAGTLIPSMDPCGFPEMNGVRAGLPGEVQKDITDGPRWVPVSALMLLTATAIIYLIINGHLSGTGISEEATSIIIMLTGQPIRRSSTIQQLLTIYNQTEPAAQDILQVLSKQMLKNTWVNQSPRLLSRKALSPVKD